MNENIRSRKVIVLLLGVSLIALGVFFWSTFSHKYESSDAIVGDTNITPTSIESLSVQNGNNNLNEITDHSARDIKFELAGELIIVELKELELNGFSLPSDKSPAYLYDKLSQRALNGEVIPARLLSNLISGCKGSFINKDDHQEALDRLINYKEFPSPDPNFSGVELPDEEIQVIYDQTERDFHYCSKLTPTQRGESRKWAKLAADQGDFLSIELLINDSETSNTERLELYEKQWSEYGYVYAPSAISLIYSGLALSETESVEKDLTKAYANYLVGRNLEISIARRRGADELAVSQLNLDHDNYESVLSSRLSAEEHLAAEQLAKDIIRNNPNCCADDPRLPLSIDSDSI